MLHNANTQYILAVIIIIIILVTTKMQVPV